MGNSTELTVPSTRRLKSHENSVPEMIRSDLVLILFSAILYIFHSLFQSFPVFDVFLKSARSSTENHLVLSTENHLVVSALVSGFLNIIL